MVDEMPDDEFIKLAKDVELVSERSEPTPEEAKQIRAMFKALIYMS